MNWVLSAGVAPFACRAPFAFRVVGRTDSTNLRLHWHRGELIFNWECAVGELRVHDPATAEQHGIKDKGFTTTADWHEIVWEARLDRMRVIVDDEVRPYVFRFFYAFQEVKANRRQYLETLEAQMFEALGLDMNGRACKHDAAAGNAGT
jgi:hypothetical protein